MFEFLKEVMESFDEAFVDITAGNMLGNDGKLLDQEKRVKIVMWFVIFLIFLTIGIGIYHFITNFSI